ncbi:MAG: BamA/TamA family outer membrane protein, partial [Candidatus Binatia bacterium]
LIFDRFTRGGTGLTLRGLYPLTALGWKALAGYSLEDTRLGVSYRLENVKITDVDRTAATVIRTEQSGARVTSSLTPRLFRDTRNHPFDPTAGSMQDLSLELAGLGGANKFFKAEANARWYYPFWKSPSLGTFVLSVGGSLAYGRGYGGRRDLPLFERFFPGGINSIRGFRILSLGPRNDVVDQLGRVVRRDPVGGSQQLIFNNEIIFPILQSLGLKGVTFLDAGNAFSAKEGINLGDMRLSVGGGVRWQSPLGPLRIELGFPLNARSGDDRQTIMFSFGGR